MEKTKKRARISGKKKLILLFDGVLLLGLIAAAIVLAVTLNKRGKGNAASVEAAPATEMHPDAAELASDAQQALPVIPTGQAAPSAYASALTLDADKTPQAVDFAALSAQGVDAVAWLHSPDTAINYPVMQTLDNEYYMSRNELGKRDKAGAIFLDCRNSTTLSEAQIMLYGNPMEDGSMFGTLAAYSDAAYFAAHPSLYLITPEKTYRLDVFAAHKASPAMSNYPTWFETDAARATYLNELRASSLIASDMTIASNATLVSLVTASDFNAGDDARFVVHAVLTQL